MRTYAPVCVYSTYIYIYAHICGLFSMWCHDSYLDRPRSKHMYFITESTGSTAQRNLNTNKKTTTILHVSSPDRRQKGTASSRSPSGPNALSIVRRTMSLAGSPAPRGEREAQRIRFAKGSRSVVVEVPQQHYVSAGFSIRSGQHISQTWLEFKLPFSILRSQHHIHHRVPHRKTPKDMMHALPSSSSALRMWTAPSWTQRPRSPRLASSQVWSAIFCSFSRRPEKAWTALHLVTSRLPACYEDGAVQWRFLNLVALTVTLYLNETL